MTVSEFCKKYSVPYFVAYEATYRIKPVAETEKGNDYKESELVSELGRIVTQRAEKHRLRMERALAIRARLHGGKIK